MNSEQLLQWLDEEIKPDTHRRDLLNLSAIERAAGMPVKSLRHALNGTTPIHYIDKHLNKILKVLEILK